WSEISEEEEEGWVKVAEPLDAHRCQPSYAPVPSTDAAAVAGRLTAGVRATAGPVACEPGRRNRAHGDRRSARRRASVRGRACVAAMAHRPPPTSARGSPL